MEIFAASPDRLANDFAGHAYRLVGAPFRLQGRDVTTGIDCIGVACLALRAAGQPVKMPHNYRIRGGDLAQFSAWAQGNGFDEMANLDAPLIAGDLILCHVGLSQRHLMVVTPKGFVHAHYGQAKVVVMPPPSPWPMRLRWRLTAPGK